MDKNIKIKIDAIRRRIRGEDFSNEPIKMEELRYLERYTTHLENLIAMLNREANNSIDQDIAN